jgi:hypothetical protein
VPFKTELVTVLKRLKESSSGGKGPLKIVFADKYVLDFMKLQIKKNLNKIKIIIN